MKDRTTEEDLDELLDDFDHNEEVYDDSKIDSDESEPVKEPVEVSRYTVKDGDTLYRIGQDHNTSVESLKFLNGISNASLIRPGRDLFVRWVVDKGQTLSDIANAYNASRLTHIRTNASSLATRSDIDNPDKIQVGQLIRLP